MIFLDIGAKKFPAKNAKGKATIQALSHLKKKSVSIPVLTIVIMQDIKTDMPKLIKKTNIME